MNRGAGRRVVFADSSERRYFLVLLSELEERFGLEVHAYCLMGTHYHLLVRSRDGRLSEAMKHLSASYTRRVNHHRNVDGPIFRGRFHSVPVLEDAHLQILCRYIHRNPLDLVPDSRLVRYPWSSLPALLGLRPRPAWLHCGTVLDWFGGDPQRLARFVQLDDDGDTRPDWLERIESLRPVEAGGDELVALEDGEGESAQSALEDLALAAAQFRRAESEDRAGGAGGRDPSRLAIALIARQDLRLEVADLAEFFGVTSSCVRAATSRARRRYQTDERFRELIRSLRLVA